MPCLVIKSNSGERRVDVSAGENGFRYTLAPGEWFDGEIDPDCGGILALAPTTDDTAELVKELDATLGKGGGDYLKTFLAPVALVMGKSHCMSCEVRRVIANAYARLREKYGRLRAVVAIVKLWRLSMADAPAAAELLRTYLRD